MKHILVLEPDHQSAKLIKSFLQSSHLKVHIAPDSQKAIDVADKYPPDLVITELAVAGQNGLAFLYEFRSHSDWSKVPAIVHTHMTVDDIESTIWQTLGVKAFLHKPSTTLKKLKSVVLENIAQ